MHCSIRLTTNQLVLSSKIAGRWGREYRYPLTIGQAFTIKFVIYYNKVKNSNLPFIRSAHGQYIVLKATPTSYQRFSLTFECQQDVTIQLEALFNFQEIENEVLISKRTNNVWDTECQCVDDFPFTVNTRFTMTIIFTTTGIEVTVNDEFRYTQLPANGCTSHNIVWSQLIVSKVYTT
ncbi:uncharacterized protein LOC131954952 [Physella acuta]|uniref:uncharacterized protein LOC131954952 n=1 Tax=Physella acuta TaxID=109671 RepID=UPI0027DE7E0D|nr:uncharacterized protein LOC131954952 [Physella acuta]